MASQEMTNWDNLYGNVVEITPVSTEIMLLRNVPLDKSYNHTLYFSTKGEQYTYFFNKRVKTFTSSMYQRAAKNTLKVACPAEQILGCNYLMFQNPITAIYQQGESMQVDNLGKVYYAFIDRVDYINEHTASIVYTIDVMQTWYFDYELERCFVEREHTISDVAGENIVPENLDTGEYITNSQVGRQDFDLSQLSAAVLSSEKPAGADVRGSMFNNIYSGLYYRGGFKVNTDLFLTMHLVYNANTPAYNRVTFPDYDETYWAYTADTSNYVFTLSSLPAYSATTVEIESEFTRVLGVPRTPITVTVTGASNISATCDNGNVFITQVSSDTIEITLSAAVVISGFNFAVDLNLHIAGLPDDVPSNLSELETYLTSFNDDNAIVNVYQYPSFLDNATPSSPATALMTVERPSKLGSYTPKNNKLFTYPYNYILVSNNQGQTAELHWENFQSGYADTGLLEVVGTPYGIPSVFIYPLDYRKLDEDYESGLMLNDFPNCSWNNDLYKNWWNENKNSIITGTITSAVSSMVGVAGGIYRKNPIRIASNTWHIGEGIASTLASIQDHKAIPPQAKGQIQVGTLNCGIGRVGFSIYQMCCKEKQAKIIDDYFTMFGYACHEVKVPNIREYEKRYLRPHWNYVRTQGCVIHGVDSGFGLPAQAEADITRIYDNGITFWMNPDEVGDYSLDNSLW